MRLFLSAEIQQETITLCAIQNEIDKKLDFVTNPDASLEKENNYGTAYRTIYIIPTCVDDENWRIMGWSERKRISKIKKEAEVRLRIDFEKFIKSNYNHQRLMLINNIVRSIECIAEKTKSDFYKDKLISDILNALNTDYEEICV